MMTVRCANAVACRSSVTTHDSSSFNWVAISRAISKSDDGDPFDGTTLANSKIGVDNLN